MPHDLLNILARGHAPTFHHPPERCHGPVGSRWHSECFFTNKSRNNVLRKLIFFMLLLFQGVSCILSSIVDLFRNFVSVFFFCS